MLWSAAVAIALGSTSAFANVVVVKSLGPSAKAYPPGKMLPESAKITLQGGDVVTILGPSSAQTLRGPGNFDAKQVALASAAGQRGRFSAMRSTEVKHVPSIWDLDASQSGKVCVADATKVQLWRPESDGTAAVQVRSADGKSSQLSWAAGNALATWPAALPLATGAEYELQWPNGVDKSKLDVVIVPSAPSDLVEAAQLLIKNGCQNQLELLVQSANKLAN
jgi:hypothetical protein